MKGYNSQYADKNIYLDGNGNRLTIEELTESLLKDAEHGEEIAAMMAHRYRPENLHNNGDIDDIYNPDLLNLARVTHEIKSVNHADLCEQASFTGGQWTHLAQAYQSFVKRMIRWRDGYKPEATDHDQSFMDKVRATKLKMRKSTKFTRNMRNKYNSM